MAQSASTFPLLRGKEQAAREFVEEVKKRWKEFVALQKRVGTTKELWTLMTTPERTYLIMYFEARDTQHALNYMAKSKDPFDVWIKSNVKHLTGFDMEATSATTLPENVLLYGYQG